MKSPCTLNTVVYKLWLASPEAVYLEQQGVVVGQVLLKDQTYSSMELLEDKQGFSSSSPIPAGHCSLWPMFPPCVVRLRSSVTILHLEQLCVQSR